MKIRTHLTYANVVATTALFIALGGGAYAVSLVTSGEIKNGTIKSADLRDRKAVKGADVKRDALGGKEIAEQSLDASRFAPVVGSEDFPPCNPTSSAFVQCGSVTINLRRPSRVLAIATGGQQTEGGTGATAECEIRIDGAPSPIAATPGETAPNTSTSATNGFGRTIVTPEPIAAGSHEVALACNQGVGDVRIQHSTIAAIAIATK
jgi:hypothetical protein